ncbi:MAG: type II secretion system protein [Proteobacteria bacterium]|nr:type II secretion system protein [Pseudomonadota bacterium]
MITNKENKKERRISGFTLDQTILVVAVIAVLATVIISSVAWTVLTRANATRMTAHLAQIADSVGNYYQDNGNDWPANAAELQPYLAGYSVSGASADELVTPFGTSNVESRLSFDNAGSVLSAVGASGTACNTATQESDCYFTVTLSNIQAQEAAEANNAIDGKSEGVVALASTKGRLRWTAVGTGTTRVDITYFAVKKP